MVIVKSYCEGRVGMPLNVDLTNPVAEPAVNCPAHLARSGIILVVHFAEAGDPHNDRVRFKILHSGQISGDHGEP